MFISRRLAGVGVGETLWQAGLGDLTIERFVGQCFLHDLARRNQLVEIDASIEAERLRKKYDILGDDVAGRARREGAAAKPAERGIEVAHANVDRGRDIRDA